MLSVIAQVNLQSWPKRLYGWYGNCKSEILEVLGTSIRSDLRWDDHVFNVSKEAAKCLGFLKRCKKYFTPFDLRTIYVTYIRPKMEFNSHLWAEAHNRGSYTKSTMSMIKLWAFE